MKCDVRDIVLSDFKHQLEITKFDDEQDSDNSYQYMMSQLDIHFKDKRKNDKSLTKTDVEMIKNILDNLDYSMREAYIRVISFLENSKCKMTYKRRRNYFSTRFNNDPGVYLMNAIDLIASAQNNDYYSIASKLGMCNSEALEFLDAYCHDDGWIEDKDEE